MGVGDMSEAYSIRFDFDCENEPPKVMIVYLDRKDVLEVFEEPTMRPEVGAEFSWEEDDWQAGPFARHLLKLLNRREGEPKQQISVLIEKLLELLNKGDGP
jgi:hypothetical protein